MRILVVNWLDRENPRAGGAEIHLHEIFGRLAARGHQVTVLASGWSGCAHRARADGMEIHRVGSRYTFSLHARDHFRRELAEPGFDVIVEDLNKVPLFTPRWGDTPVLPLVHHLFGWTAFREANPLLAAATVLLERPLPRVFRDHRAVAVSESTRDDLVRRGFRRERIRVIPNGVDLSWFRPDPQEPRFPEPTLLYLGRLQRYKRVDLVLRALARLKARGLTPTFLVAGKGAYRAPLERLTIRLDLERQVRFLGYVSEEEKRTLLRRSWVHCLTSPKEGWGIVNLEAAACGTPTVASDAPGLRDSVRDGETGHLVRHGDVTKLAERLEELVRDPGKVEALGRGAVAFAQGFSWDRSTDEMESVLGQVAGVGNPGTR